MEDIFNILSQKIDLQIIVSTIIFKIPVKLRITYLTLMSVNYWKFHNLFVHSALIECWVYPFDPCELLPVTPSYDRESQSIIVSYVNHFYFAYMCYVTTDNEGAVRAKKHLPPPQIGVKMGVIWHYTLL